MFLHFVIENIYDWSTIFQLLVDPIVFGCSSNQNDKLRKLFVIWSFFTKWTIFYFIY